MNPFPDHRWSRAASVILCSVATAGMGAAPAATSEPLKLDTVIVTTTPDYRPIEGGWQVGQVPGFLVFSHGNAAVKTVMEQLQLARAAFTLVWKDEELVRRPMTVVVTADEPEFLAWAKLSPMAMDRTALAVATPAGPVLLVNGGHDAVHRAVGRGYVLAQLRDTPLPRWLQEGIAQVVNSAEAEGDRLRVGRVQQDERNTISLEVIREAGFAAMAMDASGSRLDEVSGLANRRGDPMEIRINGLVPTRLELERYVDDEGQRREKERHTYAPTGDFLSYLADGIVMDLDKVFDPEAPDTVAWRMNAWGFTHYSLFADNQRHQPQFLKFVRLLLRENGRAPVALLQEVYGMTAGKLELNLSLYAKGARYSVFDFKLAEPFQAVKADMAAAPETNVLQLRARVLGATGRSEDARQLLARGYANPANRTPSYVTQFIALERAHDALRAGELLEDAARREQLDNAGRRMLASARLERLQQAGKLSSGDLRMVLLPLFAALNQGDQSEELFVLIGRAWVASAVPPKPEHLNALRMGLTFHPGSKQLADLLRLLEHS
jgi:hypothetical protein